MSAPGRPPGGDQSAGALLDPSAPPPSLARQALWQVAGGACYGGVLGSRNLLEGRLDLQPLYSALKVPLLLALSFALSLPCFYVLNALLGLRDDFCQVVGAIARAQAALTLVLAALAPLTLLYYVSTNDYAGALLFNAAMFGVASLAGQVLLRRLSRPWVAAQPRHRWSLRIWFAIYAFVGIQMGWALRPFVGNPDAPARFFRAEAWGNAYVVVARLIARVWSGQ